jgi:uncharacterized protein YjbI with pentapeptide repeats
MKVVKDLTHGILLNSFAARDSYYLAVSVLTFFDLDRPDEPLSEQDMWKLVPVELGESAILDGAMPKQRGEVLVRGRCFAPRGETRRASRASWRLGETGRDFNVYGLRRWESRAGVLAITDPEPFESVELSWQNAYGGAQFADNPLGQGADRVLSPAGEEIWPLPQVEDPARLIGSPGDRPPPACPLPVDQSWPSRMKKAGTYDQKWFNERWPYFPEDMDWTFFNAGQEAQQQATFFTGGEPVELVNLHPERPLVESALPRLRQRVFLNQWADRRDRDQGLVFKEAPTTLDTVWLFPHVLKGILIHRAVFEVEDEEYPDAGHLYLVTENPDEAPGSLEHHFEALTRRLDRSAQVDLAPFNAAMAQAKEDMKQIKDIPKVVAHGLEVAKGTVPSAGLSPANAASQCLGVLTASQARLDQGMVQLAEMKKLYGHMVKIDLAPMARAKEKFEALKGSIGQLTTMADTVAAKAAATKDRIRGAMMAALDKPKMAKFKAQVAAQMAPPPRDLWPEQALAAVRQARYDLSLDQERMAALRRLGLRPVALKRAMYGALPGPWVPAAPDWGLPESGAEPAELPGGLLLAAHEGPKITRLVIRPGEITDPSADVEVPGSKPTTFTAGLAPGKPVVLVRDPLETWLVEQDAGDFAGAAALADPGQAPDQGTEAMLKDAPRLLVTVYARDPAAQAEEFAPWKKAWPQAEPLPLPEKSAIFDAREKGVDLEEWIVAALGPGQPAFLPEDSPFRAKKGPDAGGLSLPLVDARGLYAASEQAMNANMAPMLARAEALKAELPEKARAAMTEAGFPKHGINPKDYFDPATLPKKPEGFMAGMDIPGMFEKTRASLKKNGLLTPERAAQLNAQEGQMTAVLEQGKAQFAEGMAKLPKSGQAFQFPDWARKMLEPLHIDPDDQEVMTREKVVFRHENGVNLKGKILSGLDLSGLDLSGVDLRGCQLQGTNLQGTRLDGADLSGTIAGGADFTGAHFAGGKAVKALLDGAVFEKARLADTDFHQAVLKGAKLPGADLSGANLEQALMEAADFTNARFTGAKAHKGYFMGADLTGADFREATATKAVFHQAKAPGADFSGTDLTQAMFWSAQADGAVFHGCKMENARFGGEASLMGADFTDTTLDKACLLDTNVSRSDFRGASLKRSYLRHCDLSQADLSGVAAGQARFPRTNLEQADLSGANLRQASLRRSRLTGADLSDSNLYGAEFYKAVAGKTDFTGANLKLTLLNKRAELLDDER